MGHKIRFSPFACISGAFLLSAVHAPWLLGAASAALFHEFCHYVFLKLTGGHIISISIGALGAKIETLPMARGREALCAAAGPLGSLLLAFTFTFFPEASICACVQGIYNLLPVYPLDGGRILRALLPEEVCAGVELFTVVMLLGVGIWFAVAADMGIFPLIPGVAAGWKLFERKIPCKEPKFAVQ